MWTKLVVVVVLLSPIRGESAEVIITTGRILGLKTKTIPIGNQYYSFRGIRYAETPERFESSVPKQPWDGVYNATMDQPACIQIGFNQTNASEDCLFINVYTPSLPSAEDKLLPVMFWIYGGAFFEGSSQSTLFTPDYFIDDSVLVVTINYRLGIFGFLSTGDERVPGNNGIKDLILGLQWVQENIKFFNGDRNKVTIFGQSAGAALTSYLTISPLTENKGYFVGAICQSGNSLSPWGFQRYPARTYEQVLNKSNCRSQRSAGLDLDCLKRLSTTSITAIETATIGINAVLGIGILNGITFSPSLEVNHTGAALLEGSYSLLQNGSVPTVPVIMGINSEEAVALQQAILLIRLLISQADIFKTLLVPQDIYASDEDKNKYIIPAIRNYYFGTRLTVLSNNSAIIRFLGDSSFNKPFRQYLTLVGDRMPQYCYEFTYVGNPSLNHPNQTGIGRVGHAEDLPYMWRNYDNIRLSRDDLKMKDKTVRLWTNFAKYGNPTHNSDNDTILQGFTWSEASVNGANVNCLNIGEELEMIENPKEPGYMLWYNLYDSYGHPNDTY